MVDTCIPRETAQATCVILKYEAVPPLPIFMLSDATLSANSSRETHSTVRPSNCYSQYSVFSE